MKIGIFWVAALAVLLQLSSRAASILDPTFNPGTGANGIVEQVLPLADGKILICGNFTAFNGRPKAYIARLNPDGSVDDSFTGNASYWVRNMSVQNDGKIVIGGFFKNPRSLIARLNTDGSFDATFEPGVGCTDSLGTAIDGNSDPFVFWTAIQPDGKILATGNFLNYNGAGSKGIVRINQDGSRDTSFNVGGGLDSWGRHIELLPGGQILLSGWFQNYNGRGFNRLARINANGAPDTTFNPFFGDKTAIYSTARVANNKYVVAGHSLNEEGLWHREMGRLNTDGSLDTAFIGYTNEKTESVAVQSDGKVIIGGYFNLVNGAVRTSVARMYADGTLDPAFQAQIDNYVWSVALDRDGKAMISGGFYNVDGVSRNGVARLITGAAPNDPPPVAPTLTATVNSSSQVTLTWSDEATDRGGYVVERKTGLTGNYAGVGTLGSSVRSFVSLGLTSQTQYYFRLRASRTGGDEVYSNEIAATTATATGGTATAAFVGLDATTQGSWVGTYGGAGYGLAGDLTALPGNVTMSVQDKADWVWAYSTTDARALTKASKATDRVAACWYSAAGFSIDLGISVPSAPVRTALYMVDFDNSGRSQTVQLIDGDSGAVLDARTVSGFSGGAYLVWDLTGQVRFNITPTSGNAVASGIFFGAAGTQIETVARPLISPRGGRYVESPSITISTPTEGAEIRYTMNGTEPTSASSRYVKPLRVRYSATIKAKAFKSGANPSTTASTYYRLGMNAQ